MPVEERSLDEIDENVPRLGLGITFIKSLMDETKSLNRVTEPSSKWPNIFNLNDFDLILGFLSFHFSFLQKKIKPTIKPYLVTMLINTNMISLASWMDSGLNKCIFTTKTAIKIKQQYINHLCKMWHNIKKRSQPLPKMPQHV